MPNSKGVQAELEALPPIDASDFRASYRHRKQVTKTMLGYLGRYGVMGHSNQPATTVQGFAESGYGDVFVIGDLLQEDIEG